MNDDTMRTLRPIPAQMPPMGLIQSPPGPGRPVSDMAWQPGYVPPTLPARRVRTKPRVPKIWLIFALLTILLLVSPAIVKFVLDLQPGITLTTVTEHTGYTGCTWSSLYLRLPRWWP